MGHTPTYVVPVEEKDMHSGSGGSAIEHKLKIFEDLRLKKVCSILHNESGFTEFN